ATPTPSEAATPTPSETASPSPSEAASPSPSEAASPSPSVTASPSPSEAATPTPSKTASPSPSEAATPTPSEAASTPTTEATTPTTTEATGPTPSPSSPAVTCSCSRQADFIRGQCICRRGWRGNGTFCEPIKDTLQIELVVVGEKWRPALADCGSVDFQTLANKFYKIIWDFYTTHNVGILSLAINRFYDGSVHVVHTATFNNHTEHHHLIEMFDDFDNASGLHFDGHSVIELCHVGFCENDGKCREVGYDRVCDCPSGFTGSTCENAEPTGFSIAGIVLSALAAFLLILLLLLLCRYLWLRARGKKYTDVRDDTSSSSGSDGRPPVGQLVVTRYFPGRANLLRDVPEEKTPEHDEKLYQEIFGKDDAFKISRPRHAFVPLDD
ncbi:PREDICTED: uncharacterized protein LOC109461758, partial [Branchiostoma belcheri]|uniref:Uncharacterized protein LOC109461758 n=1 Tax=Branchiostoma belcheri TaxID=7741 RepID=A0A6P4XSR7_BRABE